MPTIGINTLRHPPSLFSIKVQLGNRLLGSCLIGDRLIELGQVILGKTSMNYENFFPRGIAKGEAFCNRVAERKRLALNIQTGQHTLLMSPRRYGKTSLVRYVIDEMNVPYGEVNLFVAIDAQQIEQRILSGIKMIFNYASNPLIHFQDSDPATNIMDALLALENFLAQKKTHAVLFFDEVQEIAKVAEGKAIEGAVRHVAQESSYLSMIFFGSDHDLLSNMFFGRSRPLYKLCDNITLAY